MKKICFVTNGELPVPAINGGAIEQLLEILIDENEESSNFSFTIVGIYNKELKDKYKQYKFSNFVLLRFGWSIEGLAYSLCSFLKQNMHFARPVKIIYNIFVRSFLAKYTPEFDLIINEGSYESNFVNAAKKYGSNKFCYHLHSATYASEVSEKVFNNIISVGNYVNKVYFDSLEKSNPKWSILPNRIVLDRFRKKLTIQETMNLRLKLGYLNDDFIIIFCGRLIPEKGIEELIDAVLMIPNVNIKLMVIGSSNFKDAYPSPFEVKIRKKAIGSVERVNFIGYVDNQEIYKYHSISNIAVVPSLIGEAFGLVLAEYMASGLPTIATAYGELPEIGDLSTTLFVNKDINLVENLSISILKLYSNPSLMEMMSKASVERSKKFDSKKYLDEFSKAISLFNNDPKEWLES